MPTRIQQEQKCERAGIDLALMSVSVVAGVGVACAASAMYNIAVVLQASEARTIDAAHSLRLSLLKKLLQRRKWLLGMALIMLGWVAQTAALLLAPLSVVQPCLAAGLLLLVAVASRRLHENVGLREVVGILGIIGGVVLVAVCAPPQKSGHIPAGLIAVVLSVLGLLAVLPYVMRSLVKYGMFVAFSAGIAYAWVGVSTKFLADDVNSARWLTAIAWLVGTAALSGLGATSEMTSFQSRPATQASPLIFVVQVIIPVLLAPVLVNESWGQTPGGGAGLLAGVFLVCAGSALLVSSKRIAAVIPSPHK